MRYTDPTLPSRKFFDLIINSDIHMESASKIFQLRTGHIPSTHIYTGSKSREAPNLYSACRAPKETLQHIVLEFPAYTHERRTLRPERGRSELKYAEIIGRKCEALALAHYILDTRRFPQEMQEQYRMREKGKGRRTKETPHGRAGHEEEWEDEEHRSWARIIFTWISTKTHGTDTQIEQEYDYGPNTHLHQGVSHAPAPSKPVQPRSCSTWVEQGGGMVPRGSRWGRRKVEWKKMGYSAT